MGHAQPLVGRLPELAALQQLLDRAVEGSGGASLLVGDPGIGKTRLIETTVERARCQGFDIGIGRALPFDVERPLATAMDALGVRAGEVVRRAQEALSILGSGAEGMARVLLADGLTDALEARCARQPVLLVFEDLHWVDGATLAWLWAVTAGAGELPLAVVASTRPPGSGPSRLALDRLTANTLTLGPLSDDEVMELARRVAGSDLHADREAVLRTAKGSPLLVLAMLEATGGIDAVAASRGTVIASRLDELEPSARRVLQLAAVLGTVFDPSDVAALAGAGVVDVLASLDAATSAGFLIGAEGRMEFRHALHRETVLAGLEPAARAALHLDTAHHLAARGAPAAEVAEQYARGAQPGNSEAVEWLQRAAEEIADLAPAPAVELLDVAISLCTSRPPDELLLLRVRALARAGRGVEAEALGRTLARDDLDPPVAAGLQRELAIAAFVQGRMPEATAALRRCVEWELDPTTIARLYAEIAITSFAGLDLAGAAAAAQRALDEGRRLGDAAAQVGGAAMLTWIDGVASRIPSARQRAEELLSIAEQPGAESAAIYQPWLLAAPVWLELDDHERLDRCIRRGREVSSQQGIAWAMQSYDAAAAYAALRRGDLDDCAAAATAALTYDEEGVGLGIDVMCLSLLAQVDLHCGDTVAAEAHLTELGARPMRLSASFGTEQVRVTQAALLERKGQPGAALDALSQMWDLYGAIGLLFYQTHLSLPLVRLACLIGDTERAGRTAEAAERAAATSQVVAVRAIAQLAAAWVGNDPDGALSAAALAAMTPRRPLAAAALRDAALLLGQAGRRAEADRAANEAILQDARERAIQFIRREGCRRRRR